MKNYIALFRGINVGGNSPLPMKELVAILAALGAQNIKTYIQSGNAVFASPDEDARRFSDRISGAIRQQRGFAPHVLLVEPQEFELAVRQNPFPEGEADPQALHLGFLASVPTQPNLEALASLKKESERFQLIDNVFYLYAPDGVGRSKVAAQAERLLGVPMTDRNWRTVCAIREMAREAARQNGAK